MAFHAQRNDTHAFYTPDGRRMTHVDVDWNDVARRAGYNDAEDMAARDPEGFSRLQQMTPDGDVQAANRDDLDSTGLALTIGGTVGAGALADYLAGAGAVTGGAGGAAPGALPGGVMGLPGGTLAGGAAIPGAGVLATPITAGTAATAGASAATATPLTHVAPAAAKVGTAGTLGKVADLFKGASAAVGGATEAAAQNRGAESDFDLNAARLTLEDNAQGQTAWDANERANQGAYGLNTNRQSSLEKELMDRAALEMDQRGVDLKNLYKQSTAIHPSVSQFNTRGVAALSPEYLAALNDLATQGGAELAKPRTYNASTLSKLPDFTPYTPSAPYVKPKFTTPTMRQPGTLEKTGNWVAPTLGVVGTVLGAGDKVAQAKRIADILAGKA